MGLWLNLELFPEAWNEITQASTCHVCLPQGSGGIHGPAFQASDLWGSQACIWWKEEHLHCHCTAHWQREGKARAEARVPSGTELMETHLECNSPGILILPLWWEVYGGSGLALSILCACSQTGHIRLKDRPKGFPSGLRGPEVLRHQPCKAVWVFYFAVFIVSPGDFKEELWQVCVVRGSEWEQED